MSNVLEFCSCTNTRCPKHPSNHEEGCTPCIEQNLAVKTIPTCFFNLADPERNRKGLGFEEFARVVNEKAIDQ